MFKADSERLGATVEVDLDSNTFHQKWERYKKAGLFPVDVDAYVKDGKVLFAGVFSKTPSKRPFDSQRGMSREEFSTRNSQNRTKNYRLIAFEVYQTPSGEDRHAATWIRNDEQIEWDIVLDIEVGRADNTIAARANEGFVAYKIADYQFAGIRRHAVIFTKEDVGRRYLIDATDIVFRNKLATFRDKGFRVEDIAVAKVGNAVQYSAVFVANNPERLNWAKRDDVDNKIRSFLGKSPSKGLSVSIIRDGVTVFRKGYGETGTVDGVPRVAHSRSVYRLASVSKAVSGVLAFLLKKDPKVRLGLSTKVSTLVSGLPKKHTYTLGQTLSNRSGIRHYKSGRDANGYNKSIFTNLAKPVSSTAAVSAMIKAKNSLADIGKSLYSTPAYTFFAAAVEQAVKNEGVFGDTLKSYCDLVIEYLSKPNDLDLRCEDRTKPDDERSDVYQLVKPGGPANLVSSGNVEDGSWKFAGGGLEGSVRDLARFGEMIRGNRILSAAERDEMALTDFKDGTRYSYGWGYNSTPNMRWIEKGGSQQGARAILRVYLDQGLVIAIAGNTQFKKVVNGSNKWDKEDLVAQLGTLILAR